MTLRERAKKLYDDSREYHFSWFPREKFKRKCRKLASEISRNAETGTDESFALMYLDVISLRCDFAINSWRE